MVISSYVQCFIGVLMFVTRASSGLAGVVRVSVEELRKLLGVREDELVEDLDIIDVEELERKERKRLV